MKELTMFGFPVGFRPEDDKLLPLADDVQYEDTNRKYSKGMFGLLADADYRVEDEPYYDFYKAICRNEHRTLFEQNSLRYDSTVILPGTAGGEYKKTAGHFHCPIPGKAHSYPELYQVIQGTAVFVMQKVKEQTNTSMEVEECILAEVPAGRAIVIPPDYGHCTVNVGSDTLVFVNIVATGSANAYDAVKAHHGMCCYLFSDGQGGWRTEKNPAYNFAGGVQRAVLQDSAALGIKTGVPAYTEFVKDPAAFAYLNAPEEKWDEIFAVLGR